LSIVIGEGLSTFVGEREWEKCYETGLSPGLDQLRSLWSASIPVASADGEYDHEDKQDEE
jgi:hypothetical protein